ncbi:MAG: hypothetical protein ABI972_13570 [Acidobacteriota bacterium]
MARSLMHALPRERPKRVVTGTMALREHKFCFAIGGAERAGNDVRRATVQFQVRQADGTLAGAGLDGQYPPFRPDT